MELKVNIIIIIGVFFLTSTLCTKEAVPVVTAPLPSRLNFSCQILNVTANQLQKIASAFTFSTNLNASDVTIIQYKKNKSFNSTLSGNKHIKINRYQKIVIIIHGFKSAGTADWVKNMATAYHKIGVSNTLAVDWNKLASKPYLTAATSTKRVGEMVADWLLNKLLHRRKYRIRNVHLVGHSLGAHVSGFVGKRIANVTRNMRIGRISGLDVAAPLFEYPLLLSSSRRFSETDAKDVEAYHTNGGFFGFLAPVAKQDFYISYGGPIQPGCNKGLNVIGSLTCSHQFVHEIFTKTIDSTNYVARECESRKLAMSMDCDNNLAIAMGENKNGTRLNGTYYSNVDAEGNAI